MINQSGLNKALPSQVGLVSGQGNINLQHREHNRAAKQSTKGVNLNLVKNGLFLRKGLPDLPQRVIYLDSRNRMQTQNSEHSSEILDELKNILPKGRPE